jgi:hypothetical protein
MDGMAAGRLLLNSLVVFAPQRAFDERSDIFYYRVIQSVSKALASHEVRLRYCALEENDSDAQLFLARMNEAGYPGRDFAGYRRSAYPRSGGGCG